MSDDKFILSEFKKALRKNANEKIVDFDDRFSHKFDFQVQRLEDVFSDTNRAIPLINGHTIVFDL